MSAGDDNIELLVVPQDDDSELYEARFAGRDPWREDGRFCGGVPERFLDLMPWMIGRELLGRDYDPNRTLVVRLYGSDRTTMMCAPLGAVAATPIVNFQAPVKRRTHEIYRRRLEE